MKSYRKTAETGFTLIPGYGRVRAGEIVTGDFDHIPGLEECAPAAVEEVAAVEPSVAAEAPVEAHDDEDGADEHDDPAEGADAPADGAAEVPVEGAAPVARKREVPASFKANHRRKKAAHAAGGDDK